MTDKLTKRLHERDESALDEIGKKYGKLLVSIAKNITGSHEDAEECANDTLLEIWDTVPPKEPESMMAFACMIVRKNAIDKLRANTAQKRGGGEYPLAYEELSDVIESVDSDYGEGEISEAINAFLGEINAKDRKIFVARYFAFDSVAKIADTMSMSANSVSIRLSKMRKQLKDFLHERGIYV